MSTDDDSPAFIRHLESQGYEVEKFDLEPGELGIILGGDLSELLGELLATAVPTLHYPKRNSREYRDMLASGLECEDLNGIITGIRQVWEGYGWIGWVDFCAELIKSLEAYGPSEIRNAFGHVRIDAILREGQDEGELMETAVHISNSREGKEQGFDFTDALDAGLRIVDTVQSWFPGFQKALAAAHQRDEAGIRAALAALPGIKESDPDKRRYVMQGVLVLAMAHMSVVRPEAVLDQYWRHP